MPRADPGAPTARCVTGRGRGRELRLRPGRDHFRGRLAPWSTEGCEKGGILRVRLHRAPAVRGAAGAHPHLDGRLRAVLPRPEEPGEAAVRPPAALHAGEARAPRAGDGSRQARPRRRTREWAKGLVAGRTIVYSDTERTTARAPCLGISYTQRPRGHHGARGASIPPPCRSRIGGALIYLTVGVVIGVFAARYRGTFVDRALVTSTLVVSAIPYYLVALLAWIFLTQKYPIFPDTEYNPFLDNPSDLGRRTAAALAGARPDQRDGVLALHARPDGGDPR